MESEQNAEYRAGVCDSCAEPGEIKPDGDAYICRTCQNELDQAIRHVAELWIMSPLIVRKIIEDYFAELMKIQNDRSGASDA